MLDNDIVLYEDSITDGNKSSATRWNAIGKTEETAFKGIFDGNGHTVRGMYVNDTLLSSSYPLARGLFGLIDSMGIVKNLKLKNAYVYTNVKKTPWLGYVATLAGKNFGTIKNVSVDGYVYVKADSAYDVGGVVGSNAGSITNSTNSAMVTDFSSYKNFHYVGGIAGLNSLGTIYNNYSLAPSVKARSSNSTDCSSYAGGVIGYLGSSSVARLGRNYSATKSITATGGKFHYAGGIIGVKYANAIAWLDYFDSDLSGISTAIALDSTPANTRSVGGLTTSEMQTAKFAWQLNTVNGDSSNSEVWSMSAGYPVFADSAHIAAHRVIFVNDGSSTTRYTDSTGKVQKYPADPTNTDATFFGWSLADGQLLSANSVITKDTTVTAIFSSVMRHKVTFNNADGSEFGVFLADENGLLVGFPEDPVPTDTAYFFSGWFDSDGVLFSEKSVISANTVVTAQYLKKSGVTYTVTFTNDDDSTLKTYTFTYGTKPVYDGTTPTKEATAQYTYKFIGWTPDVVATTSDAIYKATYSNTVNKYEVVFKNWNGDVLGKDSLEYGAKPSYSGVTPGKSATVAASYTFSGWSPSIENVTDDAAYTAVFTSTPVTFKVTFIVAGTIVKTETVNYGSAATAPENPMKAATENYSYTFTGWNTDFSNVTSDLTVSALFSSSVCKYLVQFNNGETLLESDSVSYGTNPIYKGATPTKTATAKYTYTFKSWSPAIAAVTGAATYTAVFDSTLNSYTIAFKNGTTTLQTNSVSYGTTPVYKGATPVQAADSTYTYEFISWTPLITVVTGPATYTATFNAMKLSSSIETSSSSQTPTVIQTSVIPKFTLSVIDHMLNIQNAEMNTHYAIMDARGRILSRGIIQKETFTLTLPNTGTYIVRIGMTTQTLRIH